MPQCRASHDVGSMIWWCIQEVEHIDQTPHRDDKGREWADDPKLAVEFPHVPTATH